MQRSKPLVRFMMSSLSLIVNLSKNILSSIAKFHGELSGLSAGRANMQINDEL